MNKLTSSACANPDGSEAQGFNKCLPLHLASCFNSNKLNSIGRMEYLQAI